MNNDIACETPLTDLLREVPLDGRHMYEVHATEHHNIPYGRYCSESLALIEQLQAQLREARTNAGSEAVAKVRNGNVLWLIPNWPDNTLLYTQTPSTNQAVREALEKAIQILVDINNSHANLGANLAMNEAKEAIRALLDGQAQSSQSSDELLPCPFCGSPAEDFNPDGDMEGYSITCSGKYKLFGATESTCPLSCFSYTEHKDARAAWNTRAALSNTQEKAG